MKEWNIQWQRQDESRTARWYDSEGRVGVAYELGSGNVTVDRDDSYDLISLHSRGFVSRGGFSPVVETKFSDKAEDTEVICCTM